MNRSARCCLRAAGARFRFHVMETARRDVSKSSSLYGWDIRSCVVDRAKRRVVVQVWRRGWLVDTPSPQLIGHMAHLAQNNPVKFEPLDSQPIYVGPGGRCQGVTTTIYAIVLCKAYDALSL